MTPKRALLILVVILLASLVGWELVSAYPAYGSFITIWEDVIPNLEPVVAYAPDHGEYLVVWWNDRPVVDDIYAQRVARDGSLLSNFTIVTSAGSQYSQPAIAYNPIQEQYLVAYTYDDPSTGLDVWARLISWNGGWMSTPFLIAGGAGDQHFPAVAYNSQDNEYLVVYQNTWGSGDSDIGAQRVRATDGGLESWANVASGLANDHRSQPDVAYNPTRNQYLVVYNYWGASISPEMRGKLAAANLSGVSSAAEINICCYGVSEQQWDVSVASGPDEYLLAFTSGIITGPIYARRVSGAGMPLGPTSGFTVSDTLMDGRKPDVAYSSVYGYMVAFHRYDTTWLEDVYANFVPPGQNVIYDFPFGMNGGVGTRQEDASVACTPDGECLVVTEDNLDYGSWTQGDYEIRGSFALPHHMYLPLTMCQP